MNVEDTNQTFCMSIPGLSFIHSQVMRHYQKPVWLHSLLWSPRRPLRETTVWRRNPCMTQARLNMRVMTGHAQALHFRSTLRSHKNIMIKLTNLFPSQIYRYVHFSALFNEVNFYFCNLIIQFSFADTTISFYSPSHFNNLQEIKRFFGGQWLYLQQSFSYTNLSSGLKLNIH